MRRAGTVNADGFGIGWLASETGDSATPGVARRYSRDRPIWSDESPTASAFQGS